MPKAKAITGKQRDGLLKTLKARFEAHMHRHAGLEWSAVQARIESNSAKLWSLNEMERSGGEPDVVGIDKTAGEYILVDWSVRHDNVQLGSNTYEDPDARRRAVLRSPLRHRVRVSQRCRLLLRRSGISVLPQSLGGSPFWTPSVPPN